jgi:hypothetical protein
MTPLKNVDIVYPMGDLANILVGSLYCIIEISKNPEAVEQV